MNPYERRIIHTAVQEIEGVTSHSVGADASRRVVITLAEGVKPTHPSKGGYNRGRGGYNKGGNRGGYRGGKSSYNKNDAPAPSSPPRSDSAGASLYGKIDLNK
jgi:spoIIIJ-associated protein